MPLGVADRPHLDLVPLKKTRLEVDMLNKPTIGGSVLTKESKSRSCRGRTVRLLCILLSVLKVAQDPSSLALLKLTISISLDCEHPSAGHKALGLEFPDID